ncbi:unnamed protein product [Closterium sp. NIES-64]|nr:unnamed protein product [Closterium sp. NIES-64]
MNRRSYLQVAGVLPRSDGAGESTYHVDDFQDSTGTLSGLLVHWVLLPLRLALRLLASLKEQQQIEEILAVLEQQLKDATAEENYREAARLRDAIREVKARDPVRRLQQQLEAAIAGERYEEAATLKEELARIAPPPPPAPALPASSCTSDTLTEGVRVVVRSVYVRHRSDPERSHFFFAYRVRITNEGSRVVRLVSRHWLITNGKGRVEHVRGPGVVGQQPVLPPGASFEYTSVCPLDTRNGAMILLCDSGSWSEGTMAITGENTTGDEDDDALNAATEMREAKTGLDFLVSVLSHEKEKQAPLTSGAYTGEASDLCRGDDRPQPARTAQPVVASAAGPSVHLPSRTSSSKPPPRYKQDVLRWADPTARDRALANAGESVSHVMATPSKSKKPSLTAMIYEDALDSFKSTWSTDYPWLVLIKNTSSMPAFKCRLCMDFAGDGGKCGKSGHGATDLQTQAFKRHAATNKHQLAIEHQMKMLAQAGK